MSEHPPGLSDNQGDTRYPTINIAAALREGSTAPPSIESKQPQQWRNRSQEPVELELTAPSRTVASYQIFEATPTQLNDTRQHILHKAAGLSIGPMPVKHFFEEFMPYSNEVPEEWKEVNVDEARRNAMAGLPQCTECESHARLVDALQGWTGLRSWEGMADSCGPSLTFKDSHKSRDRGCLSYGVGVSVYSGTPFVPRAKEHVMDFANLHTWVEIRPTEAYDAFNDGPGEEATQDEVSGKPKVDDCQDVQNNKGEATSSSDSTVDVAVDSENPKFGREYQDESPKPEAEDLTPSGLFPFEQTWGKGCDTRAQLASYAGATMATQYRHHLFSVLIAGKRTRLIRWERASAVVTRAFDITEDPLILFEFFKRFRQLTLVQRGSNPQVSPASKHQAALARSLLQGLAPELWLGLAGWVFLKEGSVDIKTQPFFRLDFGGESFIVPALHCHESNLLPFGRASRGMVAIRLDKDDHSKSSVCFIKDGWRDVDCNSEHEIYNLLAQNKVRNVAKMLCGGDWFGETIGHTYVSKSWVHKGKVVGPKRLRRCLIALDVVGLPLTAFRKAHELVGGLADAMEAYEDALQKAKVMHRDISPHNILLVKTSSGEVKGCLIDWNNSIVMESEHVVSMRAMGTWRFMSVSLLMNAEAKHVPVDDRESCFYVLLWICLRHLMHNLDAATLRNLLSTFDWILVEGPNHDLSGGDTKLLRLIPHILCHSITFKDEKIAKLTSLIKDLAHAFHRRYKELPGMEVDDEEMAELLNQGFLGKLKSTLENPAWLVGQLRGTSEELERIADPKVEDWTNKVPEKMEQNLPSYMSELVRSHWHLFGTASGSGTLKRSTTLGGIQEGVDALDLEQDSERAAKRARGEDD